MVNEYEGKIKSYIDSNGDIYEVTLDKFIHKIIDNDQRIVVEKLPETCKLKTDDEKEETKEVLSEEDPANYTEEEKETIKEDLTEKEEKEVKEQLEDEDIDDEENPVNEDGTKGKNIFTYDGLKDLVRKEQDYLIKQFSTGKPPRHEKDKIELLLKIQENGSDLVTAYEKYKSDKND